MPKTKIERFPNGSVLSYPYLWRWQRNEGRFNAKDRPVCLLFSIADVKQDLTHLVILAISGTVPFEGQQALEIAPLEIHRAGLSTMKRGFSSNDDAWHPASAARTATDAPLAVPEDVRLLASAVRYAVNHDDGFQRRRNLAIAM